MGEERRKLHEQISLQFEPKPEPPMERDGKKWYSLLNAPQFWIIDRYADNPEWEPINWDESETACAKLLEEMPEVGLHRDGHQWAVGVVWNGTAWWRGTDRRRLIVDAYAKWKGIQSPHA